MTKILGYLKQFKLYQILIGFFFVCSPLESISLSEGFSLAKLSSIFVLVGWAFKGFPYRKSPMITSFWILLGYSILTILWSVDRENTFQHITTFLVPSIILAIAIKESINSLDVIIFYLGCYVLGCVIMAGTGYFMRDAILAQASFADQERLSAFGADQNAMGYLLVVGVAITLCKYSNARDAVSKYLCLFVIGLLSIIIISTGSRTGSIMLASTIGLFLITQKSFQSFIIFVCCLIVATPLIVNYVPESIWDRLFQTKQLVDDGNFSGRGDIWAMGLRALFEENFITGVGYANFTIMLQMHFDSNWASHNTYLTYLAEFGLVGFWVFFNILHRIYKYSKNIYRQNHELFIYIFIVTLLIVMMTLETEYKRWIFMIGVVIEAWYNYKYVNNFKISDR